MARGSVWLTMALAASLLAGCGSPLTAVTSGTTPGAMSATDFVTVTHARAIATSALQQYGTLREQWLAAYDDGQRDRIEDQMLVTLSQALNEARGAVSAQAGAVGTDSADAYQVADYALEQYEALRQQWASTGDITQQRQISNQMQTIMVQATQQIERVQPNTYIVRSGDNLSMIAKHTLGNSNRWNEIYQLNRDVIGGNPNVIHPGAILRLPAA